ncbi:MAG: dienelactone hydrolase family protein [Planctomycetes bacterium]|nr:dienelactone hydrolase family protein [Planctomycetota bacterium]
MSVRALARRAGLEGFVTWFAQPAGVFGTALDAAGVLAAVPVDLGLDFSLQPRKLRAVDGCCRIACVLHSGIAQKVTLELGTFRGARWVCGTQTGATRPPDQSLVPESARWPLNLSAGANVLDIEFEVAAASAFACVRLADLQAPVVAGIPEPSPEDADPGATPEYRVLNRPGAREFARGQDAARWAEGLRAYWEGLLQLEACRPPHVTVLETHEADGLQRYELSVGMPGGVAAEATLLVPQGLTRSAPGMLALHGHGPGRGRVTGALPSDGHRDYGVLLARRGYVVLAPDIRNFGTRRDPLVQAERYKRDPCDVQFLRGLSAGRWPAQTEALEWRAWLDLLAGRPEVDGARLGVLGLSLGGRTSGLCAALDRRIQAAVVSGALNLLRERVLFGQGCVKYLLPGLLAEADLPDLYALAAPRALFLELGADDGTSPEVFALEAWRRVEAVYEAAGARERLGLHIFDGGHFFEGSRSLPWLDAQLHP